MPEREFLKHHVLQITKDRARRMRKAPTPSEDLLWQALRNRQFRGLKFLRQHPIGPTIVDFYCYEKRLVVEVDGGLHQKRDVREHDKARQEYLEAYGLTILRCSAEEVENTLDNVLEKILEVVEGTDS